MSYTVSVEYTEATIRLAARYFLRRFLLPELVIGVVAVALAVVLYVAEVLSTLIMLVLGGAGIVLVGLSAFVAWRYVRQAQRKFAAMGEPYVEWTFASTRLGTRSGLGTVEVPWSAVKKVWQFPELWLLFFEGGGYSTLPVAPLTAELRMFILKQINR